MRGSITRWFGITTLGTLLATLSCVGVLHATITAPSLVVRSAVARYDPEGTVLRIEGNFPFAELVQRDYPLNLFVRQVGEGTRFIAFTVHWGALAGDDARVMKGLDRHLAHAIHDFAHETDQARFLGVQPGAIEVQLQPDFPTGLAEAQLFVFYEGLVIFSNPMPFLIDESDK